MSEELYNSTLQSYEEIESAVAELQESNILSSKTATLGEKIKYVSTLQEIPGKLQSLLSNFNGEEQDKHKELREKIIALRNTVFEFEKERLGQVVREYEAKVTKVKEHANLLINKLDEFINFEDILSEISFMKEIEKLTNQFEELRRETTELRQVIDKSVNLDVYHLSLGNIEREVERLRKTVREIKKNQIKRYNTMVGVLNGEIDKLVGNTEGLSEDLITRIGELTKFNGCETFRVRYDSTNYFKNLRYEELVRELQKVNQLIEEIGKHRRDEGQEGSDESGEDGTPNEGEEEPVQEEEKPTNVAEQLEAELKGMEDTIARFESEFSPEITADKLVELRTGVNELVSSFTPFELNKLNKAQEHLTEEQYQNFKTRLTDVQRRTRELNQKILQKESTEKNEFEVFKERFKDLETRVEDLTRAINAKFVDSGISEKDANDYIGKLVELETELNTLKGEVGARNNVEGGLNPDQYAELDKKYAKLKEEIDKNKGKIEAYVSLNGKGFYDLSIEEKLNFFENAINEAGRPVNKENRKELDKISEDIARRISILEDDLLTNADQEKYDSEMKKVDAYKQRYEELSQRYHKNCPLRVRAVRTAKKWYKKHPILMMIATGLAALAVTHFVVGPVIIPAIMHGNMLISSKVVALRPILASVNKLLGGMINASIVNTSINGTAINVWQLANGLMLSPTITSTSLLKGIAMVAGGSATLVAPLVVGLKSVVGKMRKKDKNKEKKNNIVARTGEKVKETVGKIPEKIKPKKKDSFKNLREYLMIEDEKEREQYFSDLSEEQQKELLSILELIKTQNKAPVEEVIGTPVEEETNGRGRN